MHDPSVSTRYRSSHYFASTAQPSTQKDNIPKPYPRLALVPSPLIRAGKIVIYANRISYQKLHLLFIMIHKKCFRENKMYYRKYDSWGIDSVLSFWHCQQLQGFGSDKLKYFIGDVTNARCSYRVCLFFFRMDKRRKDRPRLCRHLGFGSVLRRAVSYQLINFLYKFTAFDHFDGFQFLSGSTSWRTGEHLEVFNRATAFSLIESSTAASQKKWALSKTIKKMSLPTEAGGIDSLTIKINVT